MNAPTYEVSYCFISNQWDVWWKRNKNTRLIASYRNHGIAELCATQLAHFDLLDREQCNLKPFTSS